MNLNIYPSGSITKSDRETRRVWTKAERDIIRRTVLPHTVSFFDPDAHVANLSDTEAMFGRDIYQVKAADFVIVDARDRRGLGIGVEMLAAKVYRIPLLVVCPAESHYSRSNVIYRGGTVSQYVHPHILTLADAVVQTFEEAGQWICQFLQSASPVKDLDTVHRAIEAYESRMLQWDEQYTAI